MDEESLRAGHAARAVAELAAAARSGLPGARLSARYDLRYRGQSFELEVRAGLDAGADELRALFDAAHEQRYGYRDPAASIELVNVRVSAIAERAAPQVASAPSAGGLERATRGARFGQDMLETRVLRGVPLAGERCAGPAVWELPDATVVVPPGWAGTVDVHGTLVLERL